MFVAFRFNISSHFLSVVYISKVPGVFAFLCAHLTRGHSDCNKISLSYLEHLTGGDVPRFDAGVGARCVKDLASGVYRHASHGSSVTFENLQRRSFMKLLVFMARSGS